VAHLERSDAENEITAYPSSVTTSEPWGRSPSGRNRLPSASVNSNTFSRPAPASRSMVLLHLLVHCPASSREHSVAAASARGHRVGEPAVRDRHLDAMHELLRGSATPPRQHHAFLAKRISIELEGRLAETDSRRIPIISPRRSKLLRVGRRIPIGP
jgi:hypothetical protein